MADEKKRGHEARPEHRSEDERNAAEGRARRPYRKPRLASGDRLEETTLASCLTGPQFCGPYALEA